MSSGDMTPHLYFVCPQGLLERSKASLSSVKLTSRFVRFFSSPIVPALIDLLCSATTYFTPRICGYNAAFYNLDLESVELKIRVISITVD